MPHDVIMPALGMAQDTGKLVSWLKQPGDAVAEGEPLFEVETDKSVMEVEAQADGFLGKVSATAGDDVPVGSVVAVIAETLETASASPLAASNDVNAQAASEDSGPVPSDAELPEGKTVIMPALGMAQDTGKLVKWHKAPCDAVSADGVLFEVETDKSVMEVEAGHDGYVAACLALEGEEVPVGQPAAIISTEKPENPIHKSVAEAASQAAGSGDLAQSRPDEAAPQAGENASQSTPLDAKPEAQATGKLAPGPAAGGKILASPKAKWLAHERRLDLARLVEAGAPQPFHAKDIETLATMPMEQSTAPTAQAWLGTLHIQAEVPASGLSDYITWMQEDGGIELQRQRIFASFAAGALRSAKEVSVSPLVVETADRNGNANRQADPDRTRLSQPVADDESHPRSLIIRDLGDTDIVSVQLSAPEVPVVSVGRNGDTLALCLDFTPGQLGEDEAIGFVREFAGRLKDPLRQLL